MPDISHTFGADLALSPTGDLAVEDGPPLTQQRLLRRLLTNPGDYIWQLDYGAGLGAMVGQPASSLRIQAIIRSQVWKEATVARNPVPVVTVTSDNAGTVTASVVYGDASTGETVALGVLPPPIVAQLGNFSIDFSADFA
jgi:phage baseplate assembly protein W